MTNLRQVSASDALLVIVWRMGGGKALAACGSQFLLEFRFVAVHQFHEKCGDGTPATRSAASLQGHTAQQQPRLGRQVYSGRSALGFRLLRSRLTRLLFLHDTTVYRNVAACELLVGVVEGRTGGFRAGGPTVGILFWDVLEGDS